MPNNVPVSLCAISSSPGAVFYVSRSWLLDSVYESLVMFFVPYFAVHLADHPNGLSGTVNLFSTRPRTPATP